MNIRAILSDLVPPPPRPTKYVRRIAYAKNEIKLIMIQNMIGALMSGSWGKKNTLAAYQFIESASIVLSECIYRTLYEYFKLPHPIYRLNHCDHYDYTIYKRAKYTFYRCIKEAVLDNLAIIKNKFSVPMVDCIYLWLKWVRELIFYKTFLFRAGLIELGHWDRQCFFFSNGMHFCIKVVNLQSHFFEC